MNYLRSVNSIAFNLCPWTGISVMCISVILVILGRINLTGMLGKVSRRTNLLFRGRKGTLSPQVSRKPIEQT